MKLILNALIKFVFGAVLLILMIFLPAGTFNYLGGWIFIGLLFIPMFIMGIVMFLKAPKLLEKRLNNKEKEKTQKGVVGLSGLMFFAGFIVSSLDFRFSWSSVPIWLISISSVLFLMGYIVYMEVMRENEFLSRTIEVQENQKVISTGLYGIIRHPMYFATLLMFMPIPLILGSFVGLIPFVFYPIIIVIRIINEEKVLSKELEGYIEYKQKVKYRLIPFIW